MKALGPFSYQQHLLRWTDTRLGFQLKHRRFLCRFESHPDVNIVILGLEMNLICFEFNHEAIFNQRPDKE